MVTLELQLLRLYIVKRTGAFAADTTTESPADVRISFVQLYARNMSANVFWYDQCDRRTRGTNTPLKMSVDSFVRCTSRVIAALCGASVQGHCSTARAVVEHINLAFELSLVEVCAASNGRKELLCCSIACVQMARS